MKPAHLALAALLLLTGSAPADGVPHASWTAYPNAVISLRDPAGGTQFYVETNGHVVVALDKDGKFLWSADALAAGKPPVGEPVVRHMTYADGQLELVVGKKHRVTVAVKDGTVR